MSAGVMDNHPTAEERSTFATNVELVLVLGARVL